MATTHDILTVRNPYWDGKNTTTGEAERLPAMRLAFCFPPIRQLARYFPNESDGRLRWRLNMAEESIRLDIEDAAQMLAEEVFCSPEIPLSRGIRWTPTIGAIVLTNKILTNVQVMVTGIDRNVLAVHGLGDCRDWDRAALAKWDAYCAEIHAELHAMLQPEAVAKRMQKQAIPVAV